MELPDEIMNRLRLLLDKTVSNQSNKQMKAVLQNPAINISKALILLLDKYRGDMVSFILSLDIVPKSSFKVIAQKTIANVTDFKKEDLYKIWKMLILKSDRQGTFRWQFGYETIVKEVVRVPDPNRKNILLSILYQNFKLFWGDGCKQLFIRASASYQQIFLKILLCVSHFIEIVCYLIINHAKNKEQLPEITKDKNIALTNQIINILTNTVNKPYHKLHKQCMLALSAIGQNYSESVGEIAVEVLRLINGFILIKPIRDETRRTQQIWENVFKRYSNEFNNRQNKRSQSIDQSSQQPILLEKIIDRTNQYRYVNQIPFIPSENDQAYKQKRQFLKKGIGIGGGRTVLNFNDDKNSSYNPIHFGKVSKIVQKCLHVPERPISTQKVNHQNVYIQTPLNKQKRTNKNQFSQNKIMDIVPNSVSQIQSICQTPQDWIQESKTKYQHQDSRQTFNLQNDPEVQEISNLIDLAYSFKFSKINFDDL